MALKPRETAILWTTISVILVAVLWMFGIQPIWEDYSGAQARLESEEAQFAKNQKVLKGARKIEEEFERIKKAIPQESTDEQSAKWAFSEDVNQLATTMIGRPTVGTVGSEPMKDVPGFSLLNFPITIPAAPLDKISALLKAFDQKGYLIQRVTISQRDLDSPDLKLDVEVARIVQIAEEKKEERRRIGFGARR